MYSKTRFSSLILTVALGMTCLPAHAVKQADDKGNSKHPTNIEVEMKAHIQSASSADKDSSEVLASLKKLLAGLGHRSIDQIGECLSADVTTFDDQNHKVVYGKEAVLEHIKSNVIGAADKSPVKHITVHDPFVHVKGDSAMVSFRATKQMADNRILESWCSEVYEHKDGRWLILQFRSNWKPARSLD